MENSKRTTDRFLRFLKMQGAQSASALAKEFKMTVEGARLQLAKLTAEGLVEPAVMSKGVGRPTILYSTTEKANRSFPDFHQELSVQILNSVRNTLGQNALDEVINARAVLVNSKYSAGVAGANSFEEKLDKLVAIRTEEGYLAEWKKVEDEYWFIENHCPICFAATNCQSLCRSELNTFNNVLGPNVTVERTEHILANGRRCVYRIITMRN